MKETLLVTFMTFILSIVLAGFLVLSEHPENLVSPIPPLTSLVGKAALSQK